MAGGVDAIHSHVVDGAAALRHGHQANIFGVYVLGELGAEESCASELAALDQADRLQIRFFEMQAIGGHHLHAV